MIQVALIDRMGDDLSVVNAARGSFSKVHLKMETGDEKLIKYLADHNHWSPLPIQVCNSISGHLFL